MRILNSGERNEIIIKDNISGGDIAFYYRLPTYPERIRYANELFQRVGEVVKLIPEVRVEYGALILTGIGPRSFGDNDGRPISSDPKDENYTEDWKELVKADVPEMLAQIAQHVYESSYIKKSGKATGGITIDNLEGVEPDFTGKK